MNGRSWKHRSLEETIENAMRGMEKRLKEVDK